MVNVVKVLGEAWDKNWGLNIGKKTGRWEAQHPKDKKTKRDFNTLLNDLKRYKKRTPLILYPEKVRLQMQINALNRGREIGLKEGKKKMKAKKYWK